MAHPCTLRHLQHDGEQDDFVDASEGPEDEVPVSAAAAAATFQSNGSQAPRQSSTVPRSLHNYEVASSVTFSDIEPAAIGLQRLTQAVCDRNGDGGGRGGDARPLLRLTLAPPSFRRQDFHYAHQGTQAVQSVMEHALLKTLWKTVMEKVSSAPCRQSWLPLLFLSFPPPRLRTLCLPDSSLLFPHLQSMAWWSAQ